MSKYIIAPFRFAEYGDEYLFQYAGRWLSRLAINTGITISGDDYFTISLETPVGYRVVDLTENQIRRIEKYLRVNQT